MMHEAESYTLDGLIINSTIPFPIAQVAKAYGGDRPVDCDPPTLVSLDRRVRETNIIPLKQIIPYFVQTRHSVDPAMWEFLWNREADVYGNTGRPNRRPWVDMTERTLIKGFVLDRFKDIFFKPKDVSSIQSKGEAIDRLTKHYDHVTHFDDDPYVIFGLAKKFPEVTFIYVQPLDFGLLVTREEMERFPNIRRVAQLTDHES
jgi:hypothetical protein